ncbi:hypothetical protein ACFYTG_16595 [Streptomyces mirabilis]|uniref:hypothetical protein n=1 Tax=Streptomyces mirabilis TaxID=68239 RepID=UPI0036A3BF68
MKPEEEIRAAALHAAAVLAGHLQSGQNNEDPSEAAGAMYRTVRFAKQFEEFIKYGDVKSGR